jgi:hypothetical protein
VNVGPSAQDRRRAVDEALELVRVGATELIVGIAASRGPDELAVVAREVGEPLREALG